MRHLALPPIVTWARSLARPVCLVAIASAWGPWLLAQRPDAPGSAPPEPPAKSPSPEEAEKKEPEPPKPPADDDLGRRLIRKALTETEEDVMERAIRLMGESSERLEIGFDPGDATQELQNKIVLELDDAIKAAASRMRQSKSQRSFSTDRRRMSEPRPDESKRPRADRSDPTAAEDASSAASTGPAERELPQGALKETRRGWGHLPRREREELIQGSDEAFLERYREWIEQYYRSLQEQNE